MILHSDEQSGSPVGSRTLAAALGEPRLHSVSRTKDPRQRIELCPTGLQSVSPPWRSVRKYSRRESNPITPSFGGKGRDPLYASMVPADGIEPPVPKRSVYSRRAHLGLTGMASPPGRPTADNSLTPRRSERGDCRLRLMADRPA